MEEKLSTKYNDAVQQIKTAILKSQAKALAGVNQEQLALYYGIGRFISNNSRAGFWARTLLKPSAGSYLLRCLGCAVSLPETSVI